MSDNEQVRSLPYIDFEHRQFVCRDGQVFTLKAISKMVLEKLITNQTGMPKPPVVPVTLAGGHIVERPNPEDPAYLQALADWGVEKNKGLMRYAIVYGVANEPPADIIAEFSQYMPQGVAADIKYLWVVSHLGDDGEDVELFSEAIMGQTLPTEKGVAQAENSFPGDGSGAPGESALVAATPD